MTDLKMFVGAEFYTVSSFIREARVYGVSKRISPLPSDIVPGKSRLFLAHRTASISTPYPQAFLADLHKTLKDYDVQDGLLLPLPDTLRDTSRSLAIRCAYDLLREEVPEIATVMASGYELTFKPAVFAYCIITEVQYVLKEGEGEEAVGKLGLPTFVEAVKMRRTNEGN